MPPPAPPKRSAALRVAIRGRGRAGRALGRALAAAAIPVAWVPRRAAPGAVFDVLVLAVPDDAIAGESERLLGAGARARCAMHLSGALPAEILGKWRRTGSVVVSFHPLRSFAGGPAETAAGADVAIEGDPRGAAIARRIAGAIGARSWLVPPAAKPLYHAAAAAAAGGTAILVALAAEAARRAGMPSRRANAAMAALAAEAAGNVGSHGFPRGLTGPLARGDEGTLRLHRRALARLPDLAAAYDALAAGAANLGPHRAPRKRRK
jgi:predicted short-subunit dehydrogenase-like oxidoreductase (DUF2520 family)